MGEAATPLPGLQEPAARIEASSVSPLRADDWVFEAVDFHCSSICRDLRSRLGPRVGAISDEDLKEWMWVTRSSVNKRRQGHTHPHPHDTSTHTTSPDDAARRWACLAECDAHSICNAIAREIVLQHCAHTRGSPALGTNETSSSKMTPWSCPRCTLHNEAHQNCCDACDGPRPCTGGQSPLACTVSPQRAGQHPGGPA